MRAAVKMDVQSTALAELSARVQHDLQCLDYPAHQWVRAHQHSSGQHVYDAVIIGGGQSGLAVAFGLLRDKVDNILVLDENPAGCEGPWVTYARMVTLRTRKYLTGPDLGVASLTFRAFWEAQYGEEAWDAVVKVPREEWMRYLRWFRATLEIPVQNETRVALIDPVERGLFRLEVSGAGARGSVLARKVVLATGIQGGGEWHLPGFITSALPKHLYAHTSGPIDFAPLIGKKIGILGGGASAFDNAQYALGVGISEAHVFMRRSAMPRINPIRFMENAGFLRHFADLDDAAKYAAMDFFLGHSQPPTNDTFSRASAYSGFHLHLGEPWLQVEEIAAGVRVTTPKTTHDYAFIVASTGLLTDVALRPELAAVAGDIAHWRDVFVPPEGKQNRLIDDHPYLGPSFEFMPKTPEAADRLHGLFVFNYSALASLGLSAAALSGLKFAVPKVAAGITSQLFQDDAKEILGDFLAYSEVEFIH
jgi:cation diffusion facilitator CzcD-associated flavoprotein CzcO